MGGVIRLNWTSVSCGGGSNGEWGTRGRRRARQVPLLPPPFLPCWDCKGRGPCSADRLCAFGSAPVPFMVFLRTSLGATPPRPPPLHSAYVPECNIYPLPRLYTLLESLGGTAPSPPPLLQPACLMRQCLSRPLSLILHIAEFSMIFLPLPIVAIIASIHGSGSGSHGGRQSSPACPGQRRRRASHVLVGRMPSNAQRPSSRHGGYISSETHIQEEVLCVRNRVEGPLPPGFAHSTGLELLYIFPDPSPHCPTPATAERRLPMSAAISVTAAKRVRGASFQPPTPVPPWASSPS